MKMESEGRKKIPLKLRVDLQCGSCSALVHQSEPSQKFCSCCGAGFERYCLQCRKKVGMFFEEWWPEEDECLRTYTPAKRCPSCNSSLDVPLEDSHRNSSPYHN